MDAIKSNSSNINNESLVSDILTDDAINEMLWSEDIEGFVSRAKDNKHLSSDKKVHDMFEMVSGKEFQKLARNDVLTALSILCEYQVTSGDIDELKHRIGFSDDMIGSRDNHWASVLVLLIENFQLQNPTLQARASSLLSSASYSTYAWFQNIHRAATRGHIGDVVMLQIQPIASAVNTIKSGIQGVTHRQTQLPAWKLSLIRQKEHEINQIQSDISKAEFWRKDADGYLKTLRPNDTKTIMHWTGARDTHEKLKQELEAKLLPLKKRLADLKNNS